MTANDGQPQTHHILATHDPLYLQRFNNITRVNFPKMYGLIIHDPERRLQRGQPDIVLTRYWWEVKDNNWYHHLESMNWFFLVTNFPLLQMCMSLNFYMVYHPPNGEHIPY